MPIKEDEQYFFEQGEAFLLPTKVLYPVENGRIYNLGLPAFTVCEAFAAEAYLKSLIKIESGVDAPRTHNLMKLFLLLSPGSQAEIRKDWMERHAWSVLNVPHGCAPDRTPFEAKVPETFEEALELSAETFLRFRYDFHNHHAWSMRALAYLVRRCVLLLRPEWLPDAGTIFASYDDDPRFVRAGAAARPAESRN